MSNGPISDAVSVSTDPSDEHERLHTQHHKQLAEQLSESCTKISHDYVAHPVAVPRRVDVETAAERHIHFPVVFCRRCGHFLLLERGTRSRSHDA